MSYRSRLASIARAKEDYETRKQHEQVYRDYMKKQKSLPPSERGRLPPPPPPTKAARAYAFSKGSARVGTGLFGFGKRVGGRLTRRKRRR